MLVILIMELRVKKLDRRATVRFTLMLGGDKENPDAPNKNLGKWIASVLGGIIHFGAGLVNVYIGTSFTAFTGSPDKPTTESSFQKLAKYSMFIILKAIENNVKLKYMFCPKQAASIHKTFGTPAQLKKWIDEVADSDTVTPQELCFLDIEYGAGFANSGYVIASPVMLNLWVTK